jgi:hypothetical protein
MVKEFDITETVTYNHTIRIEIPNDKEDDFEEFADRVASEAPVLSVDEIRHSFNEQFGSENVDFIEDGSPNVEIECW